MKSDFFQIWKSIWEFFLDLGFLKINDTTRGFSLRNQRFYRPFKTVNSRSIFFIMQNCLSSP